MLVLRVVFVLSLVGCLRAAAADTEAGADGAADEEEDAGLASSHAMGPLTPQGGEHEGGTGSGGGGGPAPPRPRSPRGAGSGDRC